MSNAEAGTTPDSSYVNIHLPGGQVVALRSKEATRKWYEEIAKLNSVDLRGNASQSQVAQAAQHMVRNSVQQALSGLQQALSDESIGRNRILAETEAAKPFAERRLVAPGTPIASLIAGLTRDESVVALYVLALYTGTDAVLLDHPSSAVSRPSLSKAAATAATLTTLYERDIWNDFSTATAKAEGIVQVASARLSAIEAQAAAKLSEYETVVLNIATQSVEIDKLREEFRHQIEAATHTINVRAAELEQQGQQTTNAITNKAAQVETKIASMIDDHQASLAAARLQAQTADAVTFWQTKAANHTTNAATFRNLLVVFGLLFLLGIGGVLYLEPNVPIIQAPVWATAALVLALIFGVWVGRVLVRLYLAQVALREDADERAVMTRTYIALTREGKAEPEHVSIVLRALFRPAAKGADADDSSPSLPQELIVKQLTGSK